MPIPARATLLLLWLVATAASAAPLPVPSPPTFPAKSWFLQDMQSGRVLAEREPDQRIEPASITKVMTAYAAFHELAEGNLKLTDQVTVSKKAWQMEGSRMFIEVGKQVSVEDLLKGIIIQSGNDASVALAEHIAGSEEVFAALMNRHAARLGMGGTNYVNSTGLPDAEHYTSARDIATLTRALITEFPDYYRWFSEKEMVFNGITQHNRNRLLWRDESVDGVKTGHTSSAGFCLVSSAARDGMRLVAVVLGAASEGARSTQSIALLNYGFRFFETHRLYERDKSLTEVRIWKGAAEKLPLGLTDDLYLTIPRGRYPQLKASMELPKQILAPAAKGGQYGSVKLSLADETVAELPLVALEDVPEGGFWKQLTDSMRLWFE